MKKISLLFSSTIITSIAMSSITISCFKDNDENYDFLNWDNANVKESVNGEGSSSVYPIINAIVGISEGELTYSPTGSGSGLKAMDKVKPAKQFGMTSSTKHPKNDKWLKNSIRTITWAIDAIAIAIHMPSNLTLKNNAKRPIIDINKLRDAYSGKAIKWNELIINLENYTNNSNVKVYGRNKGKSASGTAEGFMHTLLKGVTFSKEEKKSIENHETLPNDQLTGEANTNAYTTIKNNEGSLTYVSLGYGLKNENENIKLAVIKVNDNEFWEPSIENVENGLYKWRRPFNIIYDSADSDSRNFVKYLLSEEIQEFIKQKDFIKLSKEQKELQQDVWKSDEDIYQDIKSSAQKLAKFAYTKGEKIVLGLNI
ncbi:PstS family phosphate ABC transporter substrate-binding protein [Mycoplasmopsis lipofaciens]|uniref:PstS family phosphate ABC transporter substrate-binding protein n=1 Tax=Mycoplasmopsis lipofaciens TaxID=114884 RepID=UPI0004895C51|nr:substrate-binding domain-containing protein [Mycoplasmopsis lipofaciens]